MRIKIFLLVFFLLSCLEFFNPRFLPFIVFSWMITVIVGSTILIASLKINQTLGVLFKNKLYFASIFCISLFFVSISYLLNYSFVLLNILYISIFSVIVLFFIKKIKFETIN
jgi:hypothetical protein